MTPLALVASGWFYPVNFYTQNPEIMKKLLDAGAELEARDTGADGYTPLAYAIFGESYALARMLIEAGADVNSKGHTYEDSVFHVAAGSYHGEDAVEMLQLLLDEGADPFAVDRFGQTPLIEAVYRGRGGNSPEVVEMLLDIGIDTTVIASGNSELDGKTALDLMEWRMGREEEYRLLFEGSDAYARLKELAE